MDKMCVECKRDAATAWINTLHVCSPCYWRLWRRNKGKVLFQDEVGEK